MRTIALLLLLMTSNTFAFDFFGQQCRFPNRLQSFAFGAAESFGSEFPIPVIVDDVCWRLGQTHGKKALFRAKKERDLNDCYDAYDYGVEQGLEAEQTDMAMPTYCYHIGLQFGYMLLSEWARQGAIEEVGEACIEEYERGFSYGENNRPQLVESNNKLAHCFRTGYQDAWN